MIWLILLAIIAILLLGALIAPMRLIIDTDHNVYRLQWGLLFRSQLLLPPEEIRIELKVAFFKKVFEIFPGKGKAATGVKKEKKKSHQAGKKKKPRKIKPDKMLRLVKNLTRTFKLRVFRLELDTDDYVYNAWLFPLGVWLSNSENRRVQINFQGRNSLVLILENRAWRILTTLIRSYFFT